MEWNGSRRCGASSLDRGSSDLGITYCVIIIIIITYFFNSLLTYGTYEGEATQPRAHSAHSSPVVCSLGQPASQSVRNKVNTSSRTKTYPS